MKKSVSKKQIAFILVAVCLVGLIGIGVSYSYFLANISTSKEENKNSNISTTTITQVVMDMQGKISSDGAYPGHKMVKEVVVRGIGADDATPANASIQITPDLGDFKDDVTWKLYKSDSPITCTSTEHIDGGQFYEESSCNISSSATLELQGSSDSDYLNIVVNPNTETRYYLVVEYANKENQSNQMGKSFSIDIGLGEKQFTPLEKIIASVDTTGKCPTINSDGTVNATKKEATDGYLCSAEDDYGTSYYYRGNVTNNYVKFGSLSSALVYGYYSDTSTSYSKYDSLEACQNASSYNKKCTVVREKNAPMYWRIVRINGDGTVRVIYDGTSAHANGEKSTDRQIGYSAFNEYWKKDNVRENTYSHVYEDNAGFGYMYGNREFKKEYLFGTTCMYWSNTESYYVAKEYTFNESNKTFTLKDPISVLATDLTDAYIGYYTANEGNFDSDSYYSGVQQINGISEEASDLRIDYTSIYVGSTSKEAAQTNTNSSTIKTYLDNWYKNNILDTDNEQYVADNNFCNDRSFHSSRGYGYGPNYTEYNSRREINLTCPQKNDAFTVSDTTHGNGALTYPIGLISYDEVALAGGYGSNYNYYLYSSSNYWTSSPEIFWASYGGADGTQVCDGNANCGTSIGNSEGVRPVFNLKADILSQGSGTAEDPYRLSLTS